MKWQFTMQCGNPAVELGVLSQGKIEITFDFAASDNESKCSLQNCFENVPKNKGEFLTLAEDFKLTNVYVTGLQWGCQ